MCTTGYVLNLLPFTAWRVKWKEYKWLKPENIKKNVKG